MRLIKFVHSKSRARYKAGKAQTHYTLHRPQEECWVNIGKHHDIPQQSNPAMYGSYVYILNKVMHIM